MTSNDALTQKYHYLFLGTAVYNWMVAVSMLRPAGAYEALNITPMPSEDYILHLCCLLIGLYGFCYYWASQDFPRYADLVWFAALGKVANLVLACVDIFLGVTSWQLMVLLFPDAVLVALFYNALMELKKVKKA